MKNSYGINLCRKYNIHKNKRDVSQNYQLENNKNFFSIISKCYIKEVPNYRIIFEHNKCLYTKEYWFFIRICIHVTINPTDHVFKNDFV